MSLSERTPAPVTVVAPATGVVVAQDDPADVTTTTAGASFRPQVTATVPPPPT